MVASLGREGSKRGKLGHSGTEPQFPKETRRSSAGWRARDAVASGRSPRAASALDTLIPCLRVQERIHVRIHVELKAARRGAARRPAIYDPRPIVCRRCTGCALYNALPSTLPCLIIVTACVTLGSHFERPRHLRGYGKKFRRPPCWSLVTFFPPPSPLEIDFLRSASNWFRIIKIKRISSTKKIVKDINN